MYLSASLQNDVNFACSRERFDKFLISYILYIYQRAGKTFIYLEAPNTPLKSIIDRRGALGHRQTLCSQGAMFVCV